MVQTFFAAKIKAEGSVTFQFQNIFSSMADFRDVMQCFAARVIKASRILVAVRKRLFFYIDSEKSKSPSWPV